MLNDVPCKIYDLFFGTECQRFTGIVVGRILHHRTSGLEILFTWTTFLFDWHILFLLFRQFFKIWIAIRVPMKTPLTGQLQLLLRIKEREGWNERKSESNRWQNGACCNWMKHFWKWHKNMLILRIILQHCGRNAVIHLAFVLSWWQNTLFRATRACLVLVINKNIFIYIFM